MSLDRSLRIELRQSYARIGPRAEQQAGRYAHARQYRRMRGQLRRLRIWLGRVIRDVELTCSRIFGPPIPGGRPVFDPLLESGPSEALVFGAFGTWPIGPVP